MRKISIAISLLFAASLHAAGGAKLRFDHLWIMVSPGAPERAALEKAGFRIAPELNRHDGQGTASVTTEFLNGYIELMWVEPTVPVVPELSRAVEKFRNRAAWRTSGWSPFGINLVRTTAADPVYPPTTWSVTAPWMEPGTSMLILTARDDTKSPAISVHAIPTDEAANTVQAAREGESSMFHHPIGVKRITAVRLIAPRDYTPAPAINYVKDAGIITLGKGGQWLIEMTFDGGAKKKSKDLRPDLPLIIRY